MSGRSTRSREVLPAAADLGPEGQRSEDGSGRLLSTGISSQVTTKDCVIFSVLLFFSPTLPLSSRKAPSPVRHSLVLPQPGADSPEGHARPAGRVSCTRPPGSSAHGPGGLLNDFPVLRGSAQPGAGPEGYPPGGSGPREHGHHQT